MKYSIRKPQGGRAHLCAPLPPSVSGLSGKGLLQILQEGVKPLVGTVGSRTRACSRCCVPLVPSIDASGASGTPRPQVKALWHSLEAHRGTCPPPSSETLLKPHESGHHALNIIKRLAEDREDTPSLRLGVHGCFPSGLLLLTLNKSQPLLCHLLHQTQHNGNKCGMAHSQWSLCYWLRCNGFSILLKANITILSWVSVIS